MDIPDFDDCHAVCVVGHLASDMDAYSMQSLYSDLDGLSRAIRKEMVTRRRVVVATSRNVPSHNVAATVGRRLGSAAPTALRTNAVHILQVIYCRRYPTQVVSMS
jgi:hypothetical protein